MSSDKKKSQNLAPGIGSTVRESTSSAPATSRLQGVGVFLRVLSVRIRFIALFAATGCMFVYWDSLANYYAKWTRPMAEAVAGSDTEFYCPMCPQVLRDEMATCPICMMPLSKRKKMAKEPLPEGVLARVNLSSNQFALGGIRVVEVGHQPLTKSIRTVGFVEVDERKLARISARAPGRIEKTHVDFTGKKVIAGEPLIDLYSPELSVAMGELLTGQQLQKTLKGLNQQRRGAMLQRAKEKLLLLGMAEGQIQHILESGEVEDAMTIPAPRGGVVLKKYVVEGQYVKEGSPLYEIADLSSVWLKARIYEDQLPYVAQGQEIQAKCSAYPSKVYTGRVAFIDPVVDLASRTIDVRFDLSNNDRDLLPGMYVEISLQTPMTEIEPFKNQVAEIEQGPKGDGDAALIAYQKICPVTKMKLGSMGKPCFVNIGDRKVFLCCKGCVGAMKRKPEKYMKRITSQPVEGVLAIPSSAVIDMGSRKVVYREKSQSVFEAIEVVLGPRVGDSYPVVAGLSAGDRIAGAGAFLIDAETRLNPAASAAYFGASGGASGEQTATGSSKSVTR